LTHAAGFGKKVVSVESIILRVRSHYVSCSERKRELRRRRHRTKKTAVWKRKLEKATVSEKAMIAEKLRSLTPGCEVIIERLDLEKR
jgi:hypothetical protein